MEKRHSNKLTMLEGVHAYLVKHESIISSMGGMIQIKEKLLRKIAEIHNKENQRSNVLKGKKEAKELYRDNVTTHGLGLAANLFDLGNETKNPELTAQSDFTRSGLEVMRDTDLLNILDTIKENAEANLEALLPYNITPEKLQSFVTLIAVYRSTIDNKQASASIKISARKTLPVLFKESTLILKSLDKMMEEFYDTEKQFYVGYKTARSIKDFGIRHKPETLNPELKAGGVEGEKEINA